QLSRKRLCERQAQHAESTIGLDLDQPLCQHTPAAFRQAAVEDVHARQAVGILTEIGEDRCVAILYQGVTETFAVELEVGQRDVRIGVQDLEPHAGHQRAGRYEAFVERRVASPVLPGNER